MEFAVGKPWFTDRVKHWLGDNPGRAMSGVLQGYKRLAYGELDQVGFVVDVEFVHQAGFVPLHGLGADDQ